MFGHRIGRAKAVCLTLVTMLAVAFALPTSALAQDGTPGISNSGARGEVEGGGFAPEPWHVAVLAVGLVLAGVAVLRRTREHPQLSS